MRVLITGITGMAGSHLAEYLLNLGDCEVHGIYDSNSICIKSDLDLLRYRAIIRPTDNHS